jgi:hypothetical protein
MPWPMALPAASTVRRMVPPGSRANWVTAWPMAATALLRQRSLAAQPTALTVALSAPLPNSMVPVTAPAAASGMRECR